MQREKAAKSWKIIMLKFTHNDRFCQTHLKKRMARRIRNTQRHYHIERIDVEEDLKYLLNEEIKFWNEYVLKNKKTSSKITNNLERIKEWN